MIWKHTVSSCAKTRSLYAFLFSSLKIASSLVFSSVFSTRIFMVLLRMISQTSCPSLANKFPDHILHLSRSPLKGVILMLFSPMFIDLPWLWSLVSHPRVLCLSRCNSSIRITLKQTSSVAVVDFWHILHIMITFPYYEYLSKPHIMTKSNSS